MRLSTAISALTATAPLLALTASATSEEATGTRQWAHYKDKRQDGSPARPGVSPLPIIDINVSIQTQIKNDVNAVLDEFKNLPETIQDVLKTALSKTLNQSIYKQTPDEQLAAIQKAVSDSMAKIEKTIIPSTLLEISAMDDSGDFAVLKDCVQQIIAMGGRKDDAQGSCLTTSGFSLQHLKDQFSTFVDLNTFQAPADKMNQAYNDVMAYLDSVELVPSTEALIKNSAEALRNVVLSTAASERDAANAVFNCWLDGIQMISEVSLADRQQACVNGNGNVKGSALEDIEEAYISRVNQYAGALPPTLAADVQKIGVATLTLNIGPYDNSTRTAINDAILSAVAATSGESATIVGSLLDCLNTIYDDIPTEQCNPNADPDVLQHNANIVRNYLAQFASTLPKVLVQNLNATVQASLQDDQGVEAEALRDELQALWEQASLGSEYEACELQFIDCVVATAVSGSASTSCYESKGEACQKLPAMSPDALSDSGNPYAAIISGLGGQGSWGGARRHKGRRSAKKVYTMAY